MTTGSSNARRPRPRYPIITLLATAGIFTGIPLTCSAYAPLSQQPCLRGGGVLRHDARSYTRSTTVVELSSTSRDKHVEPGGAYLPPTSILQQENSATLPSSFGMSRRAVLVTSASAAFALPVAVNAATNMAADDCLVEDLSLGQASWLKLSDHSPLMPQSELVVPAYFATYATRFLIQFDKGIASWWQQLNRSYSLLPSDQRQAKLGKAFGCLANSIQRALDSYLRRQSRQSATSSSSSSRSAAYTLLLQTFLAQYGGSEKNNEEVKRQIGLLFSMLTPDEQPQFDILHQFTATTASNRSVNAKHGSANVVSNENAARLQGFEPDNPVPAILNQDLSALLPANFNAVPVQGAGIVPHHRISPNLSLYQVGFDEEFGQTTTATPFGPLSASPLKRELPKFSPNIYALFGISGATGCALTHSVVIPLDVVKTRAQTDPEEFTDLLQGANRIIQQEGISGLLLGAQATIAGYFWYGLSVYPSYTFFKRWLGQTVLSPEMATVHANDVALAAGALAAVIASLGLTPLEAARIRVVANPEKYRPIGLTGTIGVIASEDPALGWTALYAGLPSLLVRQVIFGSIKFLAFERACEAIFAVAPYLRDATWTMLAVSLVAGGFSGALSSIVSQPADSVLTYVAQNSRGTSSLGAIEGCRIMVQEEGVSSLFRGLGSRCVWAGSIIAGQFLLYDVFRTIFGVTSDDLSQVYQVVIPNAQ